MKILHVPYSYYPDPAGGTEVYVAALSRQLQQLGFDVVIAAPSSHTEAYEHEGIHVRRYRENMAPRTLREMYGDGDDVAAQAFSEMLAIEQPDIVHLHAFSRAVSLRVVRAAKSSGIPVIFTYHSPTVTCQRGTMMRWGIEACDGLMDLHTCARCTLDGLFNRFGKAEYGRASIGGRASKVLAHLIGSVRPSFGTLLGRLNLQGGHWTALRTTELLHLRHASARALFTEVDHIVAVCQWVKEVLVCNGVHPCKITVSRQGITGELERTALNGLEPNADRRSSINIAFFGRLDPTKGVHILIEAIRSLPEEPFCLTIYGVVQSELGRQYEHELRRLSAGDERIKFHSPVPSADVISTLRNYDLLAVPSQWLETGPLVLLEAFAAGVPVIGSRLGSIAEMVRDDVDGVLVTEGTVQAWTQELRRFSEDSGLIQRLRSAVRPPRTMSIVAREMAKLYNQVQQDHAEYRPFTTTATC